MRFTTKLGLAIAFAAVVAFVAAPFAMAGVVSSNHDMAFKVPASPKAGACSHCHIPHKAGGSKLWAQATSVGTGWQAETISQLCYSCHGGTTYAYALNQNPFQADQHGRVVSQLTGATPPDIAAIPGDVPLSTDGDLKCTSCHDVHNNDHRPFIRYSTTANGVYSYQSHCQHCHPNRAQVGLKGTANVRNGYSNHPTDQAIANTARAVIAGGVAFNVVPGTNAPGPTSPANSYNLGGHRSDGTATGQMTCATCHAVHGDESGVYSATNGSSTVPVAIPAFNVLAVMEPNPITVAPYVAPICTGCHANSAQAGPGAATTYTHPIGTLRSTWTIPSPPAAAAAYKWGGTGGANDAIVCQSCHDIHYGQPNTSLLYGTIEAPVTSSNRNCVTCHSIFSAMNHHPIDVAPTYTPTARASATITNWTTFAYTRGGGNYNYPGGLVECATCHYQTGAHNNAGPFNGLPFNQNSEMCLDCHTANPSVYTSVSNGHAGSSTITVDSTHYLGSIMSPSYKKTSSWATTGLSSKWGTAAAGDGYVICESCHTLKLSGLIPGGTTSNNTAVASRVKASVRLLVEHSGNNNADTATDLCIGCHGGSPSGGGTGAGTATHPTLSMGMSSPASAAIVTKAATIPGTTTLIAGTNIVNCESCHRPHDAAQGAGALILEGCGTASNKTTPPAATGFDRATGNGGARYTEEATFCNMCHSY